MRIYNLQASQSLVNQLQEEMLELRTERDHYQVLILFPLSLAESGVL